MFCASRSIRTARNFSIIAAVGLAVVSTAGVRPASAESGWAERGLIVERLAETFGEAPKALGVTSNGAVLELFTSDKGESWTLVVTLPSGFSRVVAEGEAWTAFPGDPKPAAW
jgi:hypothetical protein